MKVTFSLTVDDLVEHGLYQCKQSPSQYAYTIYNGTGFVFSLTIIWGVVLAIMGANGPFEIGHVIASFIAGLMIALLSMYKTMRKLPSKSQIKASLHTFTDPDSYNEVTLELSKEGLTWKRETRSLWVSWKGIHEVVVKPDRIFIDFAPGQTLQIPRHAFDDDAAWKQFQERLKAGYASVGQPDTRIQAQLPSQAKTQSIQKSLP